MAHRGVVTAVAQPDNDFLSHDATVGGTRHDRLMPMLRPAQRTTSLDWMTGELVRWQTEGWLEAQHADELLRSQRAARRTEVGVLVADLVAGLVTCLAAIGRGLVALGRRLSRPRLQG